MFVTFESIQRSCFGLYICNEWRQATAVELFVCL